ncbi:MAG: DUF5995 family protein [Actinobacteria bacterium]|nr:DUF5995 family protein [Actinomycetota bacterium]
MFEDRVDAVVVAVLPPEDGLKWFNMLYLMVTEQIASGLAAQRWADGVWLAGLDVEFARLYFEAILLWLQSPARCPRAWVPLFERRFRAGIARVQFGMAGINAHINRDLPVAVVRACESHGTAPRRDTPQHSDYDRINSILEQVEIVAMEKMATGVIGEVTRDLGRLDDVVAMWDVRKARDAAWVNGEVLWALRSMPELAAHHLAALDRMAGFAGRGLLIRTEG